MREPTQSIDLNAPPVRRRKKSVWRVLGIILAAILLTGGLLYLFWLGPTLQRPVSAPLALPTLEEAPATPVAGGTAETPIAGTPPAGASAPSNLSAPPPAFVQPEPAVPAEPVCGDDPAWMVLLVGSDYRGQDYLYGLADVIRLVNVDFVNMHANMVALPRDLLVEAPAGRFTEENPMKINQAYLFGTPGWKGYLGEGGGANALAEVIRFNFGVSADHYVVVNFAVVRDFIDAIGGVEVDLPQAVVDPNPELGSFPAGRQTLNGTRALALMRIRTNYSDAFRVGNQTLVMRAILDKLMTPAVLVKVPSLISRFKDAFLTDLSLGQITELGVCFLSHFDSANLHAAQIPAELLKADQVYIPSLDGSSYVYRWDEAVVQWIHSHLMEQ